MPITWSPPGRSSSSSQAIQASARSSTGTPWRLGVGDAPELLAADALGGEHRRELLVAGAQDVDREAPRRAHHLQRARARLEADEQQAAGRSDSDVTAFVVMPAGPSGPVAVTTVTPVAKWPIVSRYARAGSGCGPVGGVVTVRGVHRCTQRAVLAEVVVVGDRADEPVRAGLPGHLDRLAVSPGCIVSVRAELEVGVLALGDLDGEVVGQAGPPLRTTNFTARPRDEMFCGTIRYSSSVMRRIGRPCAKTSSSPQPRQGEREAAQDGGQEDRARHRLRALFRMICAAHGPPRS